MSPNVGNFVHDLVEMAKATERLPELEAELNRTKDDLYQTHKHAQELELKLHDRNDDIDRLNATIRDLEVARDDAELRFLEADEKLEKVTKTFQVALEAMDDADRKITSLTAKPEPVKEQSYEEAHPKPFESNNEQRDQSEGNPTTAATSQDHAYPERSVIASESASSGTTTSDSGQSDSPPTASSTEDHSANPAYSEAPAKSEESALPNWTSLHPYAGKRYIDIRGYISRDDWLAGGGTNESYDFRY